MTSKHDNKVKQIAKQLEREGYTVQADISGYETPDGIGKNNYIPDISPWVLLPLILVPSIKPSI